MPLIRNQIAQEEQLPQTSALEAGGAGAISGLTFGAQNKLAGLASATGGALRKAIPSQVAKSIETPQTPAQFGIKTAISSMPIVGALSNLIALAGSKTENESFGDTYNRVRDASKQYFETAQSEHPIAFGAGEVGGALAGTIADPLSGANIARVGGKVLGAGAKALRGGEEISQAATTGKTAAEELTAAMKARDAAAAAAKVAKAAGNEAEADRALQAANEARVKIRTLTSGVPQTSTLMKPVASTVGQAVKAAGKAVVGGAAKGAAQGAIAGAASDDTNDGIAGKLQSAGEGALVGGLTGGAVGKTLGSTAAGGLSALASKVPLLEAAVAGTAAAQVEKQGIKGALASLMEAKAPKIGTTISNIGKGLETAGGVAGQLAGQAVGSSQSNTEQDNISTESLPSEFGSEINVDSLLKQLNIDPNTPHGAQISESLSAPDKSAEDNAQEGQPISPDVPQVTLKNGKKVQTTVTGKTVELQ